MIVDHCPVCKRRGQMSGNPIYKSKQGIKHKSSHFVPMIMLTCDQCNRIMCGACWEKHFVEVHHGNLNEIRGEHIPRAYLEGYVN